VEIGLLRPSSPPSSEFSVGVSETSIGEGSRASVDGEDDIAGEEMCARASVGEGVSFAVLVVVVVFVAVVVDSVVASVAGGGSTTTGAAREDVCDCLLRRGEGGLGDALADGEE